MTDQTDKSPEQFTHELISDEPYYRNGPQQGRPPDGTFKAGTKVRVDSDAGSYSYVTSEDGVSGAVTTDSLRPIQS